jgi:hypothetical protein
MATIKSEVQTASSLTVTGLSTLASATYCVSNTITHSTNDPMDVLVDISVATTNAVAGNKQLLVFAKASIDGTNFTSGPESGTTATDEPDLYFVGAIPLNTSTTTHRRIFSLAAAYGGVLPIASKLVLRNDLGVALTSGSAQISEVWNVAV